jgi:hypothetical protein
MASKYRCERRRSSTAKFFYVGGTWFEAWQLRIVLVELFRALHSVQVFQYTVTATLKAESCASCSDYIRRFVHLQIKHFSGISQSKDIIPN